ncbi:T9SS type A sorting domain-containing protein [Chitinispirillales bacterium ANBcel5]|uniref:T9SS type A sorting domain-containing protein n=1 Tax=Cellulosispirillum alkaliphilum TaxID=3039283 RepID=UPI002A56BF08|nr:T9SS type A sorting domain-containing protein [Chitinispirillales bacterium ANBcel5]
MEKTILKASLWSWRSAFTLYSKVIALLFALFCIASGQAQKMSANENLSDSSPKFRGRAFKASDSSIIANSKLYLSDDNIPLYGVIGPQDPENIYPSRDSTYTDENGYFEISIEIYPPVFTSNIENDSGETVFHASEPFYDIPHKDSVYSFYLSPLQSTQVSRQAAPSEKRQLQVTQGRTISIKITDWNGAKTSSISVIDLKGKTIARLQASHTGVISWDTQNVPKGVYFLRLNNNVRDISMRIVVK